MKRILLSAFACEPCYGSDEEVGWRWAKELAQMGYDVTVITRASHKPEIEKRVALTGECQDVTFIYCDLSLLHSILKKINKRNYIYYYFWQWAAYLQAKTLHANNAFDLIHHVTWVSFRQPSFMGKIGAKFYFGPIGGADEVPRGYAKEFSFSQYVIEIARKLINLLIRFDPLMRMTYREASRIYLTSSAHLNRIPSFAKSKSVVTYGIGCESPQEIGQKDVPHLSTRGKKLLFAGRSIGWKGLDIGLKVFAKLRSRDPDVTLTIVGDGPDLNRWKEKAKALGIDRSIEWTGWVQREALSRIYDDHALFFYPSLRDSGGFVVLEALSRGLPVVCFNLAGPGMVVNASCGCAVEALRDLDETVNNYADAIIATLNRIQQEPELSSACQNRANQFTWQALIQNVYSDISQS